MSESDIIYLPEVAKKMGMTEAAVRNHLRRDNFDAVPKPFRLGHRLAWRRVDFDRWLENKANQSSVGRPREAVV